MLHTIICLVLSQNLRKFPSYSFFPRNDKLRYPNGPLGSTNMPAEGSRKKPMSTIIKVIVFVSCVVALFIVILLAIFIHYMRILSRAPPEYAAGEDIHGLAQPNLPGIQLRIL